MKDMVIVKRPVLAVYRCPSISSERTDELLYGMWGVLTGEKEKGFVRICTGYGYEGWCRADGLKYGEWDVCRTWCSNRVFVQSRFADILSEPSVRSEVLISLPKGSLVTVCEHTDDEGWQTVELLDRRRGYIRCDQIGRMRTGKRSCYWQCSPVSLPPVEEDRLRRQLVDTAKEFLGTPYRWGGKSPGGVDCSGLCSLTCWINGIVIYRDSRILPEYAVREIPTEQLREGDLLYFPGHMAMYLGSGKYIHSSFSRSGVVINSLEPGSPDYLPELAASLKAVGSVFDSQHT